MRNTSAIILAAGSSSRLGRSKQLIDVNGMSLLQHTIAQVTQANLLHPIVVLGARAEAHLQAMTGVSAQIVINNNWSAGIGSSIKKGIETLIEKNAACEQAILLVCDQPLLTAMHLENLIKLQSETRKGIIASSYADTAGVPVLFSKQYFTELKSIPDEAGARSILQKNRGDTALVPFPEGEFDIDTKADLEKFTKYNTSKK